MRSQTSSLLQMRFARIEYRVYNANGLSLLHLKFSASNETKG